MATRNWKWQVTFPKALCDRLLIQRGDWLSLFEHDGRITIIKKIEGASDGRLCHLHDNARYSDEESLQDAIAKRRSAGQLKSHD